MGTSCLEQNAIVEIDGKEASSSPQDHRHLLAIGGIKDGPACYEGTRRTASDGS